MNCHGPGNLARLEPVVPLDGLAIQPCVPRQVSISLLESRGDDRSSDGSRDDTSRIFGFAAVRCKRESGLYSRFSSLSPRGLQLLAGGVSSFPSARLTALFGRDAQTVLEPRL